VGQVLFNDVVQKLGVLETDYFDLEYTDVHNVHVRTSTLCRLCTICSAVQETPYSVVSFYAEFPLQNTPVLYL